MAQFTTRGDTVFASDIDFNRACRKLHWQLQTPGFLPPKELSQTQDLLARALGADSYHALRRKAAAPTNQQAATSPMVIVRRHAQIKAAPFPTDLPEPFGPDWQRQAIDLYVQAAQARQPGEISFVAFVGHHATGKTLLAKNLVNELGGAIRDCSLDSSSFFSEKPNAKGVFVYDRPATLPTRKTSAVLQWLTGEKSDEEALLNERRTHFDPFGWPGLFFTVQQELEQDPTRRFVLCFGSLDDVMEALRSVYRPGYGSQLGAYLFDAAHVVNLDTMTFQTVRPVQMG